MKLKYVREIVDAPRNAFVIKFQYEHGDADMTTYQEEQVKLTEQQLIDYLRQVDSIAEDIDDARACGREVPEESVFGATCHGYDIPLEYDSIYRNEYATLSIHSITYFDENGVEFSVIVEDK